MISNRIIEVFFILIWALINNHTFQYLVIKISQIHKRFKIIYRTMAIFRRFWGYFWVFWHLQNDSGGFRYKKKLECFLHLKPGTNFLQFSGGFRGIFDTHIKKRVLSLFFIFIQLLPFRVENSRLKDVKFRIFNNFGLNSITYWLKIDLNILKFVSQASSKENWPLSLLL